MIEFEAAVDVKCSPERAFDFFADHRHVAEVLEGVGRWEPISSRTRGVGARYAVEMVALGLPLGSVLKLNRWRRPSEIGWVSESGLIKQKGGFTFAPHNTSVRITLRIGYEPPGAAAGSLVARTLDGVVRRRLERALARIKRRLETDSSDESASTSTH